MLGLAALAVVAVVLGRPETAMLETRAGPPAPQERGPALIVLPFESLAEDEADEVFAGGRTEELIANLMRFGELRLYSAYGSFLEPPTAPCFWQRCTVSQGAKMRRSARSIGHKSSMQAPFKIRGLAPTARRA